MEEQGDGACNIVHGLYNVEQHQQLQQFMFPAVSAVAGGDPSSQLMHSCSPAPLMNNQYTTASPFFVDLHAQFGKVSSARNAKSHCAAERRRRERINSHLAKLRTLIPSSSKMDKASLLTEVIKHLKDLKRQSSEIIKDDQSPLPTESDELTVDTTSDHRGTFAVRVSLCCRDRRGLLPDLIRALKLLGLRTLESEITTIGGRMKNVLVAAGDCSEKTTISAIKAALKGVMQHYAADDDSVSTGVTRSLCLPHGYGG